jgi:hypothetical protein
MLALTTDNHGCRAEDSSCIAMLGGFYGRATDACCRAQGRTFGRALDDIRVVN